MPNRVFFWSFSWISCWRNPNVEIVMKKYWILEAVLNPLEMFYREDYVQICTNKICRIFFLRVLLIIFLRRKVLVCIGLLQIRTGMILWVHSINFRYNNILHPRATRLHIVRVARSNTQIYKLYVSFCFMKRTSLYWVGAVPA